MSALVLALNNIVTGVYMFLPFLPFARPHNNDVIETTGYKMGNDG